MSDEKTKPSDRNAHRVRAALLMLLALPCLYLFGAAIGSFVPRNAGWTEPPGGVLVFVRNNGVHVDLALPAVSRGHDLYRRVPTAHVADPHGVGDWIAFGWGQREFYLETETWSDLTPANALRALFGGAAVMRVEHIDHPQPSSQARPLWLETEAYDRLVTKVFDSFAQGADGRFVPLPGTGYARHDVFYDARGRYNAFRTSNQWAADALAAAGVRVGIWTPFAQSIMWRFPVVDSTPGENATINRP